MNVRDDRVRVIELRAYGPDDPDGSYTATVLAAYFEAERMRASWRRLWPRLVAVAAIWIVLAETPPVISPRALVVGLSIVAAAASWVAAARWRAGARLTALLERNGTT